MSQVQPFPFESLKHYTSAEAHHLSAIYRALPPSGYESIFFGRFNELFRKYLGSPFVTRYESIYDTNYSHFVAGLPERFVCAHVLLNQHPLPLIVELDHALMGTLVDRLLGGVGHSRKSPGSITPIEEGVITFFITKLFSEIANFSGILPVPTLSKIITQSSNMEKLLPKEEKVILITFLLKIQDQQATLRLVLPCELIWVLQNKMDTLFEEAILAREQSNTKDRMRRFDLTKTIVWAEAGSVSLTEEDLAQIEKGDILILDEVFPSFDGKKVQGNLLIKIGQDVPGGFEAQIVENQESLKVQVKSVLTD